MADPVGELLSDIAANPEGDLSVPAMARRLSVSPRHLSRVFHDQVGVSPGRYVERARVAAARSLLENSEEGLDAIARRCGFGTAETMRRTFIRELGVPPSSCRAFFAGPSVHVPS